MEGFLVMVVAAFMLYMVVLPLFGSLVGFVFYYVLPYALGGLVALLLAMIIGINLLFAWWVWLVTLVWASAVFYIKKKFSALGEEIEHYQAAHAILLGGLPYQRIKNQLSGAAAEN